MTDEFGLVPLASCQCRTSSSLVIRNLQARLCELDALTRTGSLYVSRAKTRLSVHHTSDGRNCTGRMPVALERGFDRFGGPSYELKTRYQIVRMFACR